MNNNEFKIFVKSIGFEEQLPFMYGYKKYKIYFYDDCYTLWNGTTWFENISYNDLTPLLRMIRSYKLKKILE